MPSPLLPITNPKSTRYSPPAMPPLLSSKSHDDEDDPTTRLIISSYDDDKATLQLQHQQIRPLLSRTSSYSSAMSMASSPPLPTIANGNQRRRRISSDTCLSSLSAREEEEGDSLVQVVEHAADETLLITRLSLKLLSYLGVGYRWITRFMALGCYAFMLMPGFIQVGYSYFFSRQIRRGIVYGDLPRNRLDLYLPKEIDGPRPVIAFITGGAWIIGYKAWGSLLGQQLSERGVIVACIDYRNFPQGTISDMVADASKGISFVCNKIAEYGGDPNRIYVMGQSAGAHIAACTLVEQAIKEFGEGDTTSWTLSQIKTYFGLSGGYNLLNLVDHFHQRGLYRSIFLGIMEGEQSLTRYSPELMAKDPNVRTAVSRLPPFVLFHGTADYSIPSNASKSFADTLQGLGAKAESILYEGKTHTDLFLQDPMRGGKDDMLEDLVNYIYAEDAEALAKIAEAPPRRRMVPEFMLKMARSVSPF